MHPVLYWLAAAILACSLALWVFAHDRGRLRAAWGLLTLWGAVWTLTLLPAGWRPSGTVISATAVAFLEVAAIQIAVILVFDILLHRIHIPKFASEMLILGGYAAVLLSMLYKLGVNVTGIFATSAVAAAVVGFALQDMLSNIAGGIALELEGGIKPGDFIHCGEWSGWVQHVRLRHTAITSPDGDLVILPNSQLMRMAVSICSPAQRRFIPFAMPYSLDPHDLIETVEFALRASPIPGIAADPAPRCIVKEMMPGHIAYAAVVWLARPGYDVQEISAVLTRIYFALHRAGIPAAEISTLIEVKSEAKAGLASVNPVDVLRRTPILRLLADPDLFELASYLRRLSFAAGEHVLTEGEAGDSMYFIVEGRVGISFRSSDGTERQVSVMEVGDFFGEASLLTGEARTASAVALSRVDCYKLDKTGLQGFIMRLPELAEDMSVVMA
ncbi:MAG TPA: mechanosensitive ion channel family protein, partial [Bryobacteraceae bacterium]|nr:mechanosensitive ion channel family protein [Bryobacteraceae bacterium]